MGFLNCLWCWPFNKRHRPAFRYDEIEFHLLPDTKRPSHWIDQLTNLNLRISKYGLPTTAGTFLEDEVYAEFIRNGLSSYQVPHFTDWLEKPFLAYDELSLKHKNGDYKTQYLNQQKRNSYRNTLPYLCEQYANQCMDTVKESTLIGLCDKIKATIKKNIQRYVSNNREPIHSPRTWGPIR